MIRRLLCFTLLNLFFVTCCVAHGDLDERILAASNEIKAHRDSAYLYFKRGKLYFQHNEYKKSIKDLKKANSLNYSSKEQQLLFARNYFRLKKYKKTLSFAERILSSDLKHVLTIKIKAQALLKLERYKESAETFEDVIKYTNQSFPENYIEASVAWEMLDNELGRNRSVSIIEEGIGKLGKIVSLHERLINLSVKNGNYKHAINTQLQVLDFFPRKERAYFKLCELYALDNNETKAKESIDLAKQYFYKLPLRIQNTSFMKKLLENIKEKEISFKTNQ